MAKLPEFVALANKDPDFTKRADVNKDGDVSAADVVYMASSLAKIPGYEMKTSKEPEPEPEP